jgi:hypothetical protein
MAFTMEQHNALECAIADMVLVVEYGDQKVTYRSTKDMKKLLYEMKKQLGLIKPDNRKFGHYRSGL